MNIFRKNSYNSSISGCRVKGWVAFERDGNKYDPLKYDGKEKLKVFSQYKEI